MDNEAMKRGPWGICNTLKKSIVSKKKCFPQPHMPCQDISDTWNGKSLIAMQASSHTTPMPYHAITSSLFSSLYTPRGRLRRCV